MDKPVVFIQSSNTDLAVRMVRLLHGHGISGFWVTEEEARNLSKGFDFLGYRVVPGRRLRSSAESKRSREDSQETTSSDRSSVSMAASVCSAPHRWTPSASSFFPSSTDETARLLTV